MRLAYFAHDLNDPAICRRTAMLRAGGFDVALTGFWRGVAPCADDREVLPLSQSFDARMVHRAWTTLRQASSAGEIARRLKHADIFLARNLEMLAIATATARCMTNPPAIVYEVLDIHRSLLSSGAAGRALRAIERLLLRNVSLLVTSSPAFLKQYFEPRQFGRRALPAVVVENKLYASGAMQGLGEQVRPGRPWRIGWFGVIRCRRSMEMLGALARRRPDLLEIELHGRIAGPVHESCVSLRQETKAIRWGRPYRSEELPSLYSRVHFNWSIDYFEAGGNSEWLLPNRLYEGGAFGVVPLALGRTETGRWLAKRKIGIRFDDPETELEHFLDSLTARDYLALRSACLQAPRSLFIATQDDCESLATALQRAAGVCAKARPGALYAAA